MTRETDDQIAERERAIKAEHSKRIQLELDMEQLMKLPSFQRVMNDVMERGQMFASIMTGNSMTYYNAGKQDFAREIWSLMAKANTDVALDMLKPKEITDV